MRKRLRVRSFGAPDYMTDNRLLDGRVIRDRILDAVAVRVAAAAANHPVGRLVSILQGSSDTTFYIIALYFGSVGITKTRYDITYGLLADFAGVAAAIGVAYLFFH